MIAFLGLMLNSFILKSRHGVPSVARIVRDLGYSNVYQKAE